MIDLSGKTSSYIKRKWYEIQGSFKNELDDPVNFDPNLDMFKSGDLGTDVDSNNLGKLANGKCLDIKLIPIWQFDIFATAGGPEVPAEISGRTEEGASASKDGNEEKVEDGKKG